MTFDSVAKKKKEAQAKLEAKLAERDKVALTRREDQNKKTAIVAICLCLCNFSDPSPHKHTLEMHLPLLEVKTKASFQILNPTPISPSSSFGGIYSDKKCCFTELHN